MKYRDQTLYTQYKIYRDKINHLIRSSKNNYHNNYFLQFRNNIKKTWDGINKLLSKERKTDSKINLFENNQIISDQKEVANKFNTFSQI